MQKLHTIKSLLFYSRTTPRTVFFIMFYPARHTIVTYFMIVCLFCILLLPLSISVLANSVFCFLADIRIYHNINTKIAIDVAIDMCNGKISDKTIDVINYIIAILIFFNLVINFLLLLP
jgi:hypothetical protein